VIDLASLVHRPTATEYSFVERCFIAEW